MGILRKVSEETKTILLDETDFVEVRADLSKRDFNTLAAAMPNKAQGSELTIAEATAFSGKLFEALVVGWSLSIPPTIEEYYTLSAESGTAIDGVLAEHFGTLLPQSAEGKQPTS